MMKRLLQFSLIVLAFALYGIGVNIISGIASPTAAPQLASEFIEPEPTTTLAEITTTTTAPLPRLSTTQAPKPKRSAPTSASKRQISTTTTTETPKTPLEVAQSQVGKSGPYAEGGFFCAKFASWVADQAKIESFQQSDSPARLHTIAKEEGRLTDTPLPGYLVFIDLTGENNRNDYISHVGIVESVEGQTIVSIEGNADDSGLVTRQTRKVDDGYMIDFAPFSK
jgi:hypothetical protein